MNLFKALASGLLRTGKAWQGAIMIWLGSLLTASLFLLPFRRFVRSALDGSTITERLRDGIDIEVLGDLGAGFRNLITALPAGMFLLVLLAVALGAFLNGGIFNSLKTPQKRFSFAEFFSASSRNFWSFLVITLVIGVMIYLLSVILIGVPVLILTMSGSGSEKAPFITVIVSIIVFVLLSLIFQLASDYARAWQAAQEKPACFRAIGFGFRRTFRTIVSSWIMMLILFLVQGLFAWLSLTLIARWIPGTGGGVFMLFIVSQVLVLLKCVLRIWRYGSVTSLMEMKNSLDHKPSDATIQNTQV
ncbi:MAG: hypothetical protein MUE74_08930 [Bacteroidales bacterium]|jgi:hypothetical protein|nr:hypothetical protein [Bacteroidales bacterium]